MIDMLARVPVATTERMRGNLGSNVSFAAATIIVHPGNDTNENCSSRRHTNRDRKLRFRAVGVGIARYKV
jgi:hypothetical protein